ncbi:MAG: hypothetical protein L3J74_12700 [Bacteroidales bacterium]|nr:hypothetical protein [Bacteroidales bacterium]
MKIDLQTVEELELLKDNSNALSIFELLDFTTTPGGKYKLKALFRKPLPDVESIKRHQEAVKLIQSDNDSVVYLPLSSELADKLDVYYFSDSAASLAKNKLTRFIESISYRFIYKDFNKTFISGTKNLIYFLVKTGQFREVFTNIALSGLLKKYFKQISKVLELPEIAQMLETKSFNNLNNAKLLYYDQLFRDKYKSEILELIDVIYELDVLIAQAKANIKYTLNFPDFSETETPVFKASGLYHLFVKEPVKNSIQLGEDKNFIFLTGPNMAGKTTFLKACGVAVFMAHTGMGVPAESLTISYFDRLLTGLNTSDNLPKGYSYFYSEVRRIKEVAIALNESKNAFIIIDELFKGTNIKDAFEGSLRIIRSMSKRASSLFMLSSHLLELGKALMTEKALRFLYFDSKIENGKPVFNYQIKNGLSDERLGMMILENEGVFELLEH